MAKVDLFEHEARTLVAAYQKRVGELLDVGYKLPEERKQAAQSFAAGIGAINAPPLAPVYGATARASAPALSA